MPNLDGDIGPRRIRSFGDSLFVGDTIFDGDVTISAGADVGEECYLNIMAAATADVWGDSASIWGVSTSTAVTERRGFKLEGGKSSLYLLPNVSTGSTEGASVMGWGQLLADDLIYVESAEPSRYETRVLSPYRTLSSNSHNSVQTGLSVVDWSTERGDNTNAVILSVDDYHSGSLGHYLGLTHSLRLFFGDDTDTFLQHSAANTLKFVVGGTTVLTMTSAGCTLST